MHVKLLFPNLGKEAGGEAEMDDDEAVLWCERGLAQPLEHDDLGRVYAERARQVAPVGPPPLTEAELALIPRLKPLEGDDLGGVYEDHTRQDAAEEEPSARSAEGALVPTLKSINPVT